MLQPEVNIFGHVYKVLQIEYDKKTGTIIKIVYKVSDQISRTVFKSNEMITKSLTSFLDIHEPTPHPYHDFAYAPDLEKLLIQDNK
jgi:hypothetical protein